MKLNLISLRVFVVLSLMAISANHSAFAREITLEDNSILVTFDGDSGALTRLENKSTHWTIERRPELGASFRLHAPLPDRSDNFILGQIQLNLRGQTGKTFTLYSSTNLLNWISLGAVANPSGTVQYTNPAATQLQFYRVSQP